MAPSTSSRPLRVMFVGAHDSIGGAARAMTRLFMMLHRRQDELGLEVRMRVVHKTIDHPAIIGGKPTRNRREYARYFLRTRFRKYFPRQKFTSDNTLLHSQALHHSGMGRELRTMDADLYVLNWLGNGTMSIPEVGRMQKKVVWQLHDMWMFSGAEHYTDSNRAEVGYTKSSRPTHESGPDIDRETFLRKKRHWRKARPIIAPSSWLAGEVRKSHLTKNWPTTVIPHPLDIEFWRPLDKRSSRDHFGLPHDHIVVLFGAGAGTLFPHKGADLFFAALEPLSKDLSNRRLDQKILIAIFGEEKDSTQVAGLPVVFLGELDNESLRHAYSAADVMVVPSRMEAFGQVASEAHACGLPAVVFRQTGLTDIVEHAVTGFHADKDDPVSLAHYLGALITDTNLRAQFSEAARKRAELLWQEDAIAHAYARVLLHAQSPGMLGSNPASPEDNT